MDHTTMMWEKRNEKVAIKYEITTSTLNSSFLALDTKAKNKMQMVERWIFFLGSYILKPSSGYRSEEISSNLRTNLKQNMKKKVSEK
jgi:hypothetical protein